MNSTRLILLLIWMGLAPLSAETTTSWSGSSEIQFSGTSTLHDWSGNVPASPFMAMVTMTGDNQPASLKAKVEVSAAKMNTDEPKRDANMHADMKVSQHPLITADMDTAFEKIMPGGKTPTRLPFSLHIMGTSQSVDARISHWALHGDVATFDLDFELSLKKCGIEVPAALLVVSVGDTIKLHAPVKLVRHSK